jgi:hypothetical protein
MAVVNVVITVLPILANVIAPVLPALLAIVAGRQTVLKIVSPLLGRSIRKLAGALSNITCSVAHPGQ